MVKVLYVNGNVMKRGGIESFMMNYFRRIDRERVQIDFVVHGYEKGVYDDEIEDCGSTIYHVPTKSKHPIRYEREMARIFKTGQYDVVHSHLDAMSGWVLRIAKKCGVRVRIAHSHNTKHMTKNPLKIKINDIAKSKIKNYATDMFACSDDAGRWLFGDNTEYIVVKNAIDISKFMYNKQKRELIRRENGWEDRFVIGHVGRFDFQKNQEFLLEVISDLKEFVPLCKMVFIGDGDDFQKTKELAHSLGVEEYCDFMGSCSNVADLYNAMDVFVLPSRFEGLGIVAIEAQVNGLECIVSTEVPESARICQSVQALPTTDVDCWVDALRNCSGERNLSQSEEIRLAGYSIDEKAKELQDFYIEKGTAIK